MLTNYISLIKPKIILGNILSIIGGFFMASEKLINYNLLLNTLIGVSLVIASNCVINNIIDRNIDTLMERTKYRALAKKLITLQSAIIYAIILFILGYIILFYEKNFKAIYLTTISSVIYIIIYSVLTKKKSIYSTLIGSIAGATPPMIGYCTISEKIDTGAIILSIILILWQIPHFYSIAIFRIQDYQTASIPIFPIKKGIKSTKKHITCYIILFMASIVTLKLNNYISYIFLLCMEILSGLWLYIAYFTYKKRNNKNHIIIWSKKMFVMSIIIILFFNIGITLDSIIANK